MEIALIRHGPAACSTRPLSTTRFRRWIETYDAAGVRDDGRPPEETVTVAAHAARLFASDLPRAAESARRAAPGRPVEMYPLFREAELLPPPLLPNALRLPPIWWLGIARCLWLAGRYRRQSRARTLARARRAARVLAGNAEAAGSVALFGHAFFNNLIGRELRRMGWRGPRVVSRGHWHCTTFVR